MESSGNNSHSPSVHRYNTRYKKQRIDINYKEDNDVSDNNISDDDDDDDDDEEELDIYSYRQLLAELFPSKYSDDKVKATKRFMNKIVAKKVRPKNLLSDEKSCNIIIAKDNKQHNGNTDMIHGIMNEDAYDKEDDDDDEDEDVDDVDDDDDDDEDDDDDDEDDDDDDDDDDEDDDEDDEEDDEDEDEDEDDEDDEDRNKFNKYGQSARYDIYPINALNVMPNNNNTLSGFQLLTEKLLAKDRSKKFIDNLVQLANKQKKRKIRFRPKNTKCTIDRKSKIKKKKLCEKNTKQFKKLLSEKDNLDDLKYFKMELDSIKQKELITELETINSVATVEKPYRIILLEVAIPQVFKISALKKISMMENMDPSVSEYFKLKNWVDTFMRNSI